MGKLKNYFSKQDQNKLETGLAKTKNSFLSRLGKVVVGKTKIDEDFLDELESILIQADVGVATTLKIIDALEDRTKKEKYLGFNDLIKMLREEISGLLTQKEIDEARSVKMEELIHPEKDEDRAKNPEWLVMLGVCTHLGCVPLNDKGDYNGWFCPCHGSHYDTSGRIRKGPAPWNMEVPKYEFVNANTIKIG